jgi:cellobiose phosphorylase
MNNKEIIKKLKSENSVLQLETLKYITKEGNKDILTEVISLLNITDETEIRDEIITILENLKEQECVLDLATAIGNHNYKEILPILVSACWKNGLDYNEHLEIFTDVFIQSDFQLAFDAFTVIDNIETIDHAIADKCLLRLENAVEDIKEDKRPLYFELINIIDNVKEYPAE